MKKIYLLGLTSMFALAMNAQTTLRVTNPIKKANKTNTAKNVGTPNSVQTITGGLTCQTTYTPGATNFDMQFTLELTNTDAEYGDKLDITFPTGFTINSTANIPNLGPDDGVGSSDGPEAYVGITGQTITWGNDDNNYGGIVPSYDPNGPGTYVITINVDIAPTVTGMQNVMYDVSGDQFATVSADLIGGVCPVFETGMTIIDGTVTLGSPQTLTSCGNGMLDIAIRVKNFGNDSIMNFPVGYNIDGGAAVLQTVTDTILPGDSLDVLFTTQADFSAEADYVVKMWTSVSGELIPGNDTLTYDFQNTVPVDLSTTTYTNGFETAGDLFALYIGQNAGSTANWTWSTVTPHSGTRTLSLQPATNPAIADAWVMFKCMNVTAGDNYRLTYWTRTNSGFNGGISVSLGAGATSDDMNNGLEIKPYVATTPGPTWRKDSVDYLAPISGTIYLGIRGAGAATGSGTMVKLDDISIFKPAPIGIKENAASQAISVFPNPNNGTFSIRAIENNSSVEVYSIIGENVYSSTLVKGNNSVDLSNLAAGTYIVKVKSGDSTTTKRVVINK